MRRLSLQSTLLLGVVFAAVLAVILIAAVQHVMREAAERMESSLQEQIRPLVRIIQLQARLDELRLAEVELSHLTDIFAVTSQIALLQADSNVLSAELIGYASENTLAPGVREAWMRYIADLRRIEDHAARMDMATVKAISSYESASRFKFIARALQDDAKRKEAEAEIALDAERKRFAMKGLVFDLLSWVSVVLMLSAAVWFSRSLSTRIGALRDATKQLAMGNADALPDCRGADEIADLARAFVSMREQIVARETDLRGAQVELENRIEERTRALRESNEMLQAEIVERASTEAHLHLLRKAMDQCPVGIMIADDAARIKYVNPVFLQATDYASANLVDDGPEVVDRNEGAHSISLEQWGRLRRGLSWSSEFFGRRTDGTVCWESERIAPIANTDGTVTHYLSIREDVTERKLRDDQFVFQALHDQLTQLPNRVLAIDRLHQAMAAARRNDSQVALIYINLDNFKWINDTLGYDSGDRLLIAVANRLSSLVRASDTVARLGGDEFIVILSNVHAPADAEAVAVKAVGAFCAFVTLDKASVAVSLSVGIALSPEDGDDVEAMLGHADQAMCLAKKVGKNTWRFYEHGE